jgi:hypothetical protein
MPNGPRTAADLRPTIVDRIERAADVIRRGLECDSVSVGRWDREADVLRVLVNAGDLAPAEAGRPRDEMYPLDAFPALEGLLRRREPYSFGPGDRPDSASAALATAFGRDTRAAVPIVIGEHVWGELWVARTTRPGGAGGRVDIDLLSWMAAALAMFIPSDLRAARERPVPGPIELRIAGRVSPALCAEFSPLTASFEDGHTVLRGRVVDHAEMYGHLSRVQRLGLELVSLTPRAPAKRPGPRAA